jgi:hypothetical protein
MNLLDAPRSQVISALLEEGVIADRRRLRRKVKRERRSGSKCHLPLFWSTGKPDHHLSSLCGSIGGEIVSEFVFLDVLRSDERCHECWGEYKGER